MPTLPRIGKHHRLSKYMMTTGLQRTFSKRFTSMICFLILTSTDVRESQCTSAWRQSITLTPGDFCGSRTMKYTDLIVIVPRSIVTVGLIYSNVNERI